MRLILSKCDIGCLRGEQVVGFLEPLHHRVNDTTSSLTSLHPELSSFAGSRCSVTVVTKFLSVLKIVTYEKKTKGNLTILKSR